MTIHKVLRWGLILGGAAVGLLLAALVVAYVLATPRAGTVERAWLEPAHSEQYQSGSVCYSYDKKGNCSFSMPTYSTRQVPDECFVKIKDTRDTQREATWRVGCSDLASFVVGRWVELRDS